MQQIVKILQKNSNSRDFSSVGKIYFKGRNGKMIDNSRIGDIIWELDKLPIPAWHLLPYEKYWKISRPHGGDIKTGAELKYASMMTSRGCPFACLYCHIAQETEDSKSGPIGRFRIKSDERVRQELDILKNEIGVNQIFISDDSIFGMKKRAIRLLRSIIDLGLHLSDVNGMNMVHFVKKSGTPGWMVPDEEVIELLAEVGFKDVVLPFESANPRILKKWCSNGSGRHQYQDRQSGHGQHTSQALQRPHRSPPSAHLAPAPSLPPRSRRQPAQHLRYAPAPRRISLLSQSRPTGRAAQGLLL